MLVCRYCCPILFCGWQRAVINGDMEDEGEGNAHIKAAWSKMQLADDLNDQGEHEEAIKLYEEARDMFVQVHRTLALLCIVFAASLLQS